MKIKKLKLSDFLTDEWGKLSKGKVTVTILPKRPLVVLIEDLVNKQNEIIEILNKS